jgi:hypothetical protein
MTLTALDDNRERIDSTLTYYQIARKYYGQASFDAIRIVTRTARTASMAAQVPTSYDRIDREAPGSDSYDLPPDSVRFGALVYFQIRV